MRGRPVGSKNKKPKSEYESKDAKGLRRTRHQRSLENAVKLDEFLTAEAEQANAINPDAAPFHYQNTQAKIAGKQFKRVADRLKRRR